MGGGVGTNIWVGVGCWNAGSDPANAIDRYSMQVSRTHQSDIASNFERRETFESLYESCRVGRSRRAP